MEKLVVNNYGSFDVTFVKGKGATMWDVNGKKYIDFIAGIGVNCLGHSYKPLVKAISRQASRQIHISNYFFSDTGLEFAQKLLKITNFQHAYFGNSGAEANEAAIKLARKYGQLNGGDKRKTIVTLESSFHGRTLATLTATGQDKFHPDCFAPYPQGFKTIKANDFDSLKDAFDDTTAALFMEPIQGESGIHLIDKEFVQEVSKICKEKDILLIFDEVQSGIARSGKLFAYEYFDVEPDIITSAKGLGGGLPIGAVLCNKSVSDVFVPGDHGSTFGGNPVSCAGALVVLDEICNEKTYKRVCDLGELIMNKIKKANLPKVVEVRGRGLMIGIEVKQKAAEIQKAALKKGLVVLTAGSNVVRLLPPIVLSEEEAEKGADILISLLS